MYMDNAKQSKSTAQFLAYTILALGVLSTTLAALIEFIKVLIKEHWENVVVDDAQAANAVLDYSLFLIPIIIASLISIENETRQGLKAGAYTRPLFTST